MINKNSKKIAEKKVMQRVQAFNGNYVEYLISLGQESQRKIDEQKNKQKEEETKGMTFRPKTTKYIPANKDTRDDEFMNMPTWQKLYIQGQEQLKRNE